MTESLQTPDQVAGEAHRVEAVEVTYAQIPVRATILQQMVDNFQNRVRDRNTGTLIASPCRQTSEAGSQIGVLGVACRLRCQHQSAPQPTVTFRDRTAPSLTRALIVGRADSWRNTDGRRWETPACPLPPRLRSTAPPSGRHPEPDPIARSARRRACTTPRSAGPSAQSVVPVVGGGPTAD